MKTPAFIALCGLLLAATASAQYPEQRGKYLNPNVEDYEFKEGATAIPSYPQEANLIPVRIDAGGTDFRFFLDIQALSVAADEVVRYSIVLQSPHGARNVFFEGIRCDSGEYRTYATGGGGQMYPATGGWKPIESDGRSALGSFRGELQRDYFCRLSSLPKPVNVILSHVRNPSVPLQPGD